MFLVSAVCQTFIEDSVGDRVWVDLEQCKKLVENICITFQTKPSPSSSSSSSSSSGAAGSGEGGKSSTGGGDGGAAGGGGGGGEREDSEVLQSLIDDVDVEPRYIPYRCIETENFCGKFHQMLSPLYFHMCNRETFAKDPQTMKRFTVSLFLSLPPIRPSFSLATCKSLKTHILQLFSETFSRHSHPPDSVSRNLLRFLTAVVGYSEVRVIVAQKMEAWIQNPKVGGCGQHFSGCG